MVKTKTISNVDCYVRDRADCLICSTAPLFRAKGINTVYTLHIDKSECEWEREAVTRRKRERVKAKDNCFAFVYITKNFDSEKNFSVQLSFELFIHIMHTDTRKHWTVLSWYRIRACKCLRTLSACICLPPHISPFFAYIYASISSQFLISISYSDSFSSYFAVSIPLFTSAFSLTHSSILVVSNQP